MALKDSFNNDSGNYSFQAVGSMLRVYSDGLYYRYDFAQRIMVTQFGAAVSTVPFSQLDRETLIEMREKLVALGGKPPELPAEQPASPPGPRKFSA